MWNTYLPIDKQLIRQARKLQKRGKKDTPSIEEAVALSVRLNGQNKNNITTVSLERAWRKAGAPCLFPDGSSLVHTMQRARCHVSEHSLRTPWPLFAVAFPADTGLPGCLVSWTTREEKADIVYKCMLDWGQYSGPKPPVPAGKVLSVYYQKPQTLQMEDELVTVLAGFHLELRGELIATGLESPEALRGCNLIPREHVLELSQEESELMHQVLYTVCSLCVYWVVYPERLREGIPDTCPVRFVRYNGMRAHLLDFPEARSRGPMPEHFVNPHFRELRHERFHRDENGNIRIVPVSGYMTGGSPYTLEEGG